MYNPWEMCQNIYNGINLTLRLKACVEKTVHEMKTRWLCCKEKGPGTAVRNESHADNILKQERSIIIDFLIKRSNCKHYFLSLTPLETIIYRMTSPFSLPFSLSVNTHKHTRTYSYIKVIDRSRGRPRLYSFPWIAPLYPCYVPFITEC